jgi:cbb3-type cytochrome oxidase maturation protein
LPQSRGVKSSAQFVRGWQYALTFMFICIIHINQVILMTILYIIIPIAIILVSFFVLIFLWAVKNEQFDDLETPAHKILIDDWNDKLKEAKI